MGRRERQSWGKNSHLQSPVGSTQVLKCKWVWAKRMWYVLSKGALIPFYPPPTLSSLNSRTWRTPKKFSGPQGMKGRQLKFESDAQSWWWGKWVEVSCVLGYGMVPASCRSDAGLGWILEDQHFTGPGQRWGITLGWFAHSLPSLPVMGTWNPPGWQFSDSRLQVASAGNIRTRSKYWSWKENGTGGTIHSLIGVEGAEEGSG